MATNPNRDSHFPAIEKKYGQPMRYWFDVMTEIKERKYPEQIAYLKENYGFSQAHANALVQYSRGNLSSKKFETVAEYLAPLTAEQRDAVNAIFDYLMEEFPQLESTIAWNNPQLHVNGKYVLGAWASKNWVTIGPWNKNSIGDFVDRLTQYKTGTKTFSTPLDWKIDKKLLRDIVKARLKEIAAESK